MSQTAIPSFESWTLRDWAAVLSESYPGALRVVVEALETFSANEVGENEACLYFLLLSSRGYTGPKLWSLYSDRAGMSAARAINLVVEEAKLELVVGREVAAPLPVFETERQPQKNEGDSYGTD